MTSSSIHPSPYLEASAWSKFFHKYVTFFSFLVDTIYFVYSWVYRLLVKCRKNGALDVDDLYDLPPHLKSVVLTNRLEENWFNELKQYPEKPNLIRATIRTIGWKLFLLGLLLIPMVSFMLICHIHLIERVYNPRKLARLFSHCC